MEAPVATYSLTNALGVAIHEVGYNGSLDPIVKWRAVGAETKSRLRTSRVFFNRYGDPYFNALGSRIYLNDCIRVRQEETENEFARDT